MKSTNVMQNKMTPEMPQTVSENLYPFGSFSLGVSSKGSDVDLMYAAPRHVSRLLFFTSFVDFLKKHKEVANLEVIENAYVPVIKMTFNGIQLDMVFARMALQNIPEDLNFKDIGHLRNLDERCIRSINGCRNTEEILDIVKDNKENYRLSLMAIRLWAQRKGISSNILGYFGGIAWAILLAGIVQLYPNATASVLVIKFFAVFSQWSWPVPVFLRKCVNTNLNLSVWDPRINVRDRFHLMPIITPAYPHQNSTVNVSKSTSIIIKEAIKNGYIITQEIRQGKSTWEKLFTPNNFIVKYHHYIILTVTALSKDDHLQWSGLVTSKLRYFATSLEKHDAVSLVHISPKTFHPVVVKPNTCQTLWLIGLKFVDSKKTNINFTDDLQQFNDKIIYTALDSKLYRKGMKIDAKYVQRKDLTKHLASNVLGEKENEKIRARVVEKRKLSELSNCNSAKRQVTSVEKCSPNL